MLRDHNWVYARTLHLDSELMALTNAAVSEAGLGHVGVASGARLVAIGHLAVRLEVVEQRARENRRHPVRWQHERVCDEEWRLGDTTGAGCRTAALTAKARLTAEKTASHA